MLQVSVSSVELISFR